MPSEPLHDTPSSQDAVSSSESIEHSEDTSVASESELPVELSQFSQRLASFGLGETPDPLLTESHSTVRGPRRK
jgi:hypothetical protein